MYLVGEFFGMSGVVKKDTITRKDLEKTVVNQSFQIIDLIRMMYFDPDKNKWIDLKTA